MIVAESRHGDRHGGRRALSARTLPHCSRQRSARRALDRRPRARHPRVPGRAGQVDLHQPRRRARRARRDVGARERVAAQRGPARRAPARARARPPRAAASAIASGTSAAADSAAASALRPPGSSAGSRSASSTGAYAVRSASPSRSAASRAAPRRAPRRLEARESRRHLRQRRAERAARRRPRAAARRRRALGQRGEERLQAHRDAPLCGVVSARHITDAKRWPLRTLPVRAVRGYNPASARPVRGAGRPRGSAMLAAIFAQAADRRAPSSSRATARSWASSSTSSPSS